MLKTYKKSHLIINIILGLLLVFLLINAFCFKQVSYEILSLVIIIPTTLLILIFGYEWKSRRFKYELIFYIFAYCTIFLLITYLSGIFIGFTQNIYKLNLENLTRNIIPYTILITVCEVLRYEITRKGDGSNLSFVLVTLVLILVDASLFLKLYDLSTGDGQIKYICAIIMPSFFKNIALLYFTKHGGIYASLLYRLIMDLKLVVAPIFPNFGLYYDCIINTIFPILIFFITYLIIRNSKAQDEKVDIRKTHTFKYLIYTILLVGVLTINLLVGCTFKYCMIAIGSGSMTPNINKGDAVIYEKYSKDKLPQVGEVLVFKKGDRTIVHRIIEIVKIDNDERIYYTKGDNNESPDGYPIESKDIIGVVRTRIRFIGIPSVMISEMTK